MVSSPPGIPADPRDAAPRAVPPGPPATPSLSPTPSLRATASLALSLVPDLSAAHPAAVLLVDLEDGTVVYANDLATQLAGHGTLPMSLDHWSRGAGLELPDGTPLHESESTLTDLAAGIPQRGVSLTARRSSDATVSRELLWAVGIPLSNAPGALERQSVLVLLPVTDVEGVRDAQVAAASDLQHRAAMASELSITISDPHAPDDPLIWVNPAFTRVTGYASDDVLGTNCRFLQGPATDRAAVDRIRTALAEGRTVGETLLNYRNDGTTFWNQVVISPVLDETGNVTHHVGVQADITERIEVELAQAQALDAIRAMNDRLLLLSTITARLVELFDTEAGVAELPELVAPHFGDWCFATVVDERRQILTTRVVSRHEGLEEQTRLLEARRRWLEESPILTRVLHSGDVPQAFGVDTASLPGRTDPDELAALHALGLGSAIVVPLRGHDRIIGALTIVSRDVEGFSDEDVRTITDLASRSGLALDNARLYAREHSTAVTLQRSLLPHLTTIPGLDCAAVYLPATTRAEIGGDWYDVLHLPDGSVGVAVGDVVGHDIGAAAAMGQLRSVLRSHAWTGERPREVISRLDQLVRGLGMADIATCAYAQLTPTPCGGMDVRYARAGHPPPLIVSATGEVRMLDGSLTTPVGVVEVHDDVPEGIARLEVGDSLLLYTDGLVERRTRPLREGLAELADVVSRLVGGDGGPEGGPDADTMCDELVRALVSSPHEDDVCVLVIRNVGGPPAR
ncbi:SpoIIE family protein phosphatase [Oerskovia flava]|uniref:SpoIIE family protein phosphatase n=1 Tax=Oerskovia flava TaxID=2986422 RepID=UPI00223F0B60|nr:SpoIIE family protein phosphatase [Oerskovia sp. JB1-3-2]